MNDETINNDETTTWKTFDLGQHYGIRLIANGMLKWPQGHSKEGMLLARWVYEHNEEIARMEESK
jgi:hypothetical protein